MFDVLCAQGFCAGVRVLGVRGLLEEIGGCYILVAHTLTVILHVELQGSFHLLNFGLTLGELRKE